MSICIATHNRAAELRTTLETLTRLDRAGSPPFEVLVIANNCTDATVAVVASFARHDPSIFRCVEEPVPGLSQARNRAVAESRFDIVAFLDDDVDVDANWLRALWRAYQLEDPAAVGGRAYLIYPESRPAWLNDYREGLLTKVELGPRRRHAAFDELYGLNVSVRKAWFDRVGLFRTDLGRMGSCLIGSEESELLNRVAQAGGLLVYEPTAVVGHRVPHDRLRRRWFWSRTYWGHVGEMRVVPAADVSVYNFIRYAWRVVRAGGPAVAALATRGPASERFFDRSVKVVARWGDWIGLCGRIRRDGFGVAPIASAREPRRSQ